MSKYTGRAAVSVTTSETTVLTVAINDTHEIPEVLWVHLSNAAAGGALTEFSVKYKIHADDTLQVVASADEDYVGNTQFPILACSGDPTALALSGTLMFVLSVRGAVQVQLTAKAAATTVLTVSHNLR